MLAMNVRARRAVKLLILLLLLWCVSTVSRWLISRMKNCCAKKNREREREKKTITKNTNATSCTNYKRTLVQIVLIKEDINLNNL